MWESCLINQTHTHKNTLEKEKYMHELLKSTQKNTTIAPYFLRFYFLSSILFTTRMGIFLVAPVEESVSFACFAHLMCVCVFLFILHVVYLITNKMLCVFIYSFFFLPYLFSYFSIFTFNAIWFRFVLLLNLLIPFFSLLSCFCADIINNKHNMKQKY